MYTAVAFVVASLLFTASAQSTSTYDAQLVFNQAALLYTQSGNAAPLSSMNFDLNVPGNVTRPDLLLSLNSTSGGTGLGLYCSRKGVLPAPGYALWQSDLSTTVNQIYISRNDLYYSQILSPISQLPSLTCAVVNGDQNQRNNFTLSLSVIASNRTLVASEQILLANLFSRCCVTTGTCGAWKALSNAQTTNANGGAITTDFCSFPGQICTQTSNLYRLDLSGYNMSCPFPSDIISQFSQLATLLLPGNNFKGNSTAVGQTFNALQKLQFFDGTGNTQLTGSYDSGDAQTGLCNAAKRSLVSLTMTSMNASGSIPSCLYSAGSRILILELDNNNFSGTLNDTIPTNSSLQSFIVSSNNLNGSIPASLGNARLMVSIDVSSNHFTGSIPSGIGSIAPLVVFGAFTNNLTGSIPDSFGTARNLQIIDVKQNQLTGLPSAWTNSSYNASASSWVRIRASLNQISAPFPAGLAYAPQLQYLVLNENNLTGTLPNLNKMFPALRALNVSLNRLQGPIPTQFSTSTLFGQTPLRQVSGQPLQQVFDVSYNNMSGNLPNFMAKGNLQTWVSNNINLQRNGFNVSCQDGSFNYLTSICPQGALSQSNMQTPYQPAPTGTQPATTSAGPAVNSATSITTSSDRQQHRGHHGLSAGAIAGIVIGAVAGVALLAGIVALIVYRRRAGSGGGMGMGELGRSISLNRGLTSKASAASNDGNAGIGKFQHFIDEEGQKNIELSPNGAPRS